MFSKMSLDEQSKVRSNLEKVDSGQFGRNRDSKGIKLEVKRKYFKKNSFNNENPHIFYDNPKKKPYVLCLCCANLMT